MEISINYTIRPLKPEEWTVIQERYTTEFENAMPLDENRHIFFGVFYDDEIVGFFHVEKILHLNAVFLEKEHRNGGLVAAMFKTLDDSIAPGTPMIILPDKNMDKNCARFGVRSLGKVDIYRKDY